jgi:DNA-directed RNA polymerase specialized sigma24 family protein
MPKAKLMPDAVWDHARRALDQYFSRRHTNDAEDLVQDTLTILLSSNYDFGDETEFMKICYGCAKHVLYREYRREKKESGQVFDEGTFASWPGGKALTQTEMSILLEEVLQVGGSKLAEKDWSLIQHTAEGDSPERSELAQKLDLGNPNNLGVRLLRARDRLALLTGWLRTRRKSRVITDDDAT